MYGLAEVTEQIFWASTAFQTPKDALGISLNTAEGSETAFAHGDIDPILDVEFPFTKHIGTAYCKVKVRSEFLNHEPQLQSGQCWRNLFQHCAVVHGYPIAARPSQRPGLEIPLDMMAELACAERVTPFGNHLIIKGFSTLLFPTYFEEGFVFWHLVYNEDGSRVSFADERIVVLPEDETVIMQLHAHNIYHARHIVGWAPKLKRSTGKCTFFRAYLCPCK
jgi:hypothetical protein